MLGPENECTLNLEDNMAILIPSAEQSRSFFGEAHLPPLPFKAGRIRSFSGEESTNIGGSDLLVGNDAPAAIGFTDNLDEDKKQMAADSIHFAERYANSKADIRTAPVDWHKGYALAMTHCGWTMSNSTYQDHINEKVNVTMESVVLDIVKAVAGTSAPAMLSMLGGAFEKMKSDQQLVTLFDKNSTKGGNADFRILPCLQTDRGTAITLFLAVDCQVDTREGGAWFWKWKFSELKMKKVATMVEFNVRQHERNRSMMLDALDASTEEFFKGVKI